MRKLTKLFAGAASVAVDSLDGVDSAALPGRPGLLWLNSPSNPTGEVKPASWLRSAVSWARSRGCVVASDAFFPFADGIDRAGEAGVRAIIQPGGSLRDPEVIAAAERFGIAMYFTGWRVFRH